MFENIHVEMLARIGGNLKQNRPQPEEILGVSCTLPVIVSSCGRDSV
jgi:hypothetical protein